MADSELNIGGSTVGTVPTSVTGIIYFAMTTRFYDGDLFESVSVCLHNSHFCALSLSIRLVVLCAL